MNIYVEMTSEFIDRIEKYKRKKNVIDFSDMEHLALKILVRNENGKLVRTSAAAELSSRFEEILIDEYQDSNMVQEIILNSISKEEAGTPNIFMVGDVKQSIYRFRLARPELFIEKYNKYTDEDSSYQKIELHNNFRSRKEVLESVNQVFEKIMKKEFGGISYDDNAKLYYKAGFPALCEANGNDAEVVSNFEQKSEVLLVEYDGEGEDTAIEAEAKLCADKIKTIVNNPHFGCLDGKTGRYRKLKYSDIVVLMRSLGKNADTFVNVFADFGIPAISESRKGYFDSYEVALVLSFLNVTDNPRQDIALSAVLKSYFGMFSANELAVIKSRNPKKSLYDAFMLYGSGDEHPDKNILEKKARFLAQLEFYRNVSQYKTIHELIWDIVYNTGYYAYVGTMPLGANRQANLDMLIEKAKAYENTSFHGLFNFVRYIERLKSYDVDYAKASLNGENDDVVRIMTIHKSKGLEFPVVFLCNAHRGFNNQDANRKIVLDADLGIGVDYFDSKARVCSPTIVKKAVSHKLRLAGLSEEQRILYVALTRAKEKLYVSGAVKNLQKSMAKWSEQAQRKELTYTDIVSTGNYLDMIMPAALQSESGFDVLSVKPEYIALISEKLEKDRAGCKEKIMSAETDVKKDIAYAYPYKIVNHPMKMTVSELKHLQQDYDDENSESLDFGEENEIKKTVPLFISQNEEVIGAARGSAYHKIMELLDYKKCVDEASIRNFISECVLQKKLTQNMADSVEPADILKFINEPVGREAKEAFLNGKLFRERQFVLGVEAKEVDKLYETEEMILVQGVIDAYYETKDGLVLLDYKTDNVPYGSRGEEELTEKYKKQLDYYEMALFRLTGRRVIKKSIYSFKLGKEIVLDKV
jgi:ATP-dependent helicase/nuclease subunit A